MNGHTSPLAAATVHELSVLAGEVVPELRGRQPVLVGTGISTLAYGWPTSGGGWILRVSRDHPRPWTWRGGRAGEVALSRMLRRCGVPVAAGPVVIQAVDDQPAAILERWVRGDPLTADRVRSDPTMTGRIAGVLDRFHAVDLGDAAVGGVPRDDPAEEFRRALAVAGLERALHQQASRAIAELEGRSTIRTLCHRDVRLDHLIVADDGEIAGLLDLGEIGVDDPAVDLALLYGELGARAIAGICAAMATADRHLGRTAATVHRLRPLLELGPGGEEWGDPATAEDRLRARLSAVG